MSFRTKRKPAVEQTVDFGSERIVSIAAKYGVQEHVHVLHAFLECSDHGHVHYFFDAYGGGLKNKLADDSELEIQFGDFTRLFAILYRAEDGQSLRSLGINDWAFEKFREILRNKKVNKLPREGFGNFREALLEIFQSGEFAYVNFSTVEEVGKVGLFYKPKFFYNWDEGQDRNHAFRRYLNDNPSRFTAVAPHSTMDDSEKLIFGFCLNFAVKDENHKPGCGWPADRSYQQIVLGATISSEELDNLAQASSTKPGVYSISKDQFVVPTTFSFAHYVVKEADVETPEAPEATMALAKALLYGAVEYPYRKELVRGTRWHKIENDQVQALADVLRKSLVIRSAFSDRIISREYLLQELVSKLDGKSRISEIEDWDTLMPAKIEPKFVAYAFQRMPNVFEKLEINLENERVIFDGGEVSKILADFDTFLEHQQVLKFSDDNATWLISADGIELPLEIVQASANLLVLNPHEIVLRYRFESGEASFETHFGKFAKITERTLDSVRKIEERMNFSPGSFHLNVKTN